MDTRIFIDTNVVMYSVGGEHPYRAPCRRALDLIADGRVNAVVDCEVHQEILHRYISLHLPDKGRQLSQKLEDLIPDSIPITMDEIKRARLLSKRYPHIPARDLIHVAAMLNNGVTRILSADTHFDQISEVQRLDPLSFTND